MTRWKVQVNSDYTIACVFSKLGAGEKVPSLQILEDFEKFLVKDHGENMCPLHCGRQDGGGIYVHLFTLKYKVF